MNESQEYAFFFGEPEQRMYGMLYEPPKQVPHRNAGWVCCAPLGEERGDSHRLMVEWARALCREGFFVLMFDYRGYADSDGKEHDYTPEDHLADVLAAMAELERRTGVPCRGLCGLRFGATLAALAAKKCGHNPLLVLWEPASDGGKYLDALLRLVMTREMVNTGSAPKGRDEILARLASGEKMIANGHPLTDDMCRIYSSLDLLTAELSNGPSLIMQIINLPRRKIRREMEALRDQYAQAGQVDLQLICTPYPWMQPKEYRVKRTELFEPTLEWIRSECPIDPIQSSAVNRGLGIMEQASENDLVKENRAPAADGTASQTLMERIIEYESSGETVRGILHFPEGFNRKKPAILMPPAGTDSRSGRARLYVKMSRSLAQQGWVSLRPDPRGMGDSDGDLDYSLRVHHFLAVQRGLYVPDMELAMDFLEQALGIREVIVFGVCGGAIVALYMGASNERVVGVVGPELPLRYSLPDEEEKRSASFGTLRTYRYKVGSLRAWARFLTFRSKWLRIIRSLFDAGVSNILDLTHRFMHHNDRMQLIDRLGTAVNMPLIAAFRACLGRSLPMFFPFGDTDDQRCYSHAKSVIFRDYRAGTAKVSDYVVARSDHAFSQPADTDELIREVTRWLGGPTRPWASEADDEVPLEHTVKARDETV